MYKRITNQYIAGFFDGEGCVGIYGNPGKRFHLRACITQNIDIFSAFLLTEIHKRFGGSLVKATSPIYRNGEVFTWQTYSIKACAFLKAIEPYLILKKAQAKIAITWQEQRISDKKIVGGRGRETVNNKKLDIRVSKLLKDLKKRAVSDILKGSIEQPYRNLITGSMLRPVRSCA
jgi:hypothetical protein